MARVVFVLLDGLAAATARRCMQQILAPIRTRRQQYEQDIPFVIDVLKAGTDKAYAKAAKTLEKVRRAMMSSIISWPSASMAFL